MNFKSSKQRSRELALQCIYQWLIANEDIKIIEEQFLTNKSPKFSKYFFSDLVINITQNIDLLNALIKPHINRYLEELGKVEHAILYIAVYELKFHLQTPYKIIINEAVNMAKNFGAEGSYKMINKALDNLSIELREVETKN